MHRLVLKTYTALLIANIRTMYTYLIDEIFQLGQASDIEARDSLPLNDLLGLIVGFTQVLKI